MIWVCFSVVAFIFDQNNENIRYIYYTFINRQIIISVCVYFPFWYLSLILELVSLPLVNSLTRWLTVSFCPFFSHVQKRNVVLVIDSQADLWSWYKNPIVFLPEKRRNCKNIDFFSSLGRIFFPNKFLFNEKFTESYQ